MTQTTTLQFPQWNPSIWRVDFFFSLPFHRQWMERKEFNKLKNQFRNSCGGFIARPDVREIIFSRDNYKCKYCGSTENLTVDHIIPVAKVIYGDISPAIINSRENLQTLCSSCNSKKSCS